MAEDIKTLNNSILSDQFGIKTKRTPSAIGVTPFSLNAYFTRPIRTAGEAFNPGLHLGDTEGILANNIGDVMSLQQSTVKIS